MNVSTQPQADGRDQLLPLQSLHRLMPVWTLPAPALLLLLLP